VIPFRRSATALALLALPALPFPRNADPAIHYAPAENLEHIDVALIDTAKREIDLAAYVLTDRPVMQALTRAADRGVKVRVYLDGTQFAERERAKAFNDLAETPRVEIRIKNDRGAPMHLKSYQIDGRVLRTGAANFSASGLKRQDNDLVVIESAGARRSSSAISRHDLRKEKNHEHEDSSYSPCWNDLIAIDGKRHVQHATPRAVHIYQLHRRQPLFKPTSW
jgi:phosphatidylserine/phosphatidylglycerophosphate/cardiolipin synthase-like enzyme